MQQVAQGLASLGRGDDSMLMHVTPGEVDGLQKLAMAAGGSLTINPHTGLAEAGFLSSMLPMLAGAAANVALPGSGVFVGAGLGAMMNKQSPLMGAISGGIGGYGGANLASSLGTAGEAAIGNTASGIPGGMGPATESIEAARQAAIQNATSGAKLTSGLGAAASNPMDFAQNNLGSLAAVSAPLVSNMMQQPTLQNLPKQNIPYQSYAYNQGRVNPNFGQPGNTDPYFLDPGYTRTAAQGGLLDSMEQNSYPQARLPLQHMVEGGIEQLAEGGEPRFSREIYDNDSTGVMGMFKNASPTTLARYKKAARDPRLQAAAINELNRRANAAPTDVGDDTEYAAHGGLMGLNEYAAGGKLLRGPGDGMSDSIPAVIKGAKPQRAALADGEFVIPADVVSHLGNGSTEAGAKRLYSMMDKVRHARTGNPKQGKQINPDKFMPA